MTFWSTPGVAARSWLPDGGPQGGGAWEATIFNNPGDYWRAELKTFNSSAISAGDVVLVRFFLRTTVGGIEDGVGWCTFYAQYSSDFQKDIIRQVTAGSEWQEYLLPFEVSRSTGPGGYEIIFGLGADPATIEIAGLEVINYGDTYEVGDLPQTRFTYTGREPDAAWRTEAATRIEFHRKDALFITVLDEDGLPLPHTRVSVRQIDHAFEFGTAVTIHRLMAEDNGQYRLNLPRFFNAASNGNILKWRNWEGNLGPQYNTTQAIEGFQWLKDQGMATRGHVMIWPGWGNLPESINALRGTPDQNQIPGLAIAHIEDIATTMDGLVDEWDVVNEPYTNRSLMDLFRWGIIDDWFHTADLCTSPDVPLYLNDFQIISGGGRNVVKQDFLYNLLEGLIVRNVPIDGFGIQGHFSSALTSPDRIYEVLDRFAQLDLDLRITEFDMDINDRQLQQDYLRDFYTIVFSHPAVVGIQQWGYWAGDHWRPNAAMFNVDWSPRPHARTYFDLVWREWTTQASGRTDSAGSFVLRGFHGTYEVAVDVPSRRTFLETILLSKGGSHMTIQIDHSSFSFPEPAPRLSSLRGGRNRVSWTSASGAEYRAEITSDLIRWIPLSDWMNGNGGSLSVDFSPDDLPLLGVFDDDRLMVRVVYRPVD